LSAKVDLDASLHLATTAAKFFSPRLSVEGPERERKQKVALEVLSQGRSKMTSPSPIKSLPPKKPVG
jgi:hypothetical protein